MAVGEFKFPKMNPIKGVRLGTASAGIKTVGRQDVMLMEIAEGSCVSGVFTQNAFCAAPVKVSKQHIKDNSIHYLLTNSGNANACTGEQGYLDALESCQKVAAVAQIEAGQVLPFSTGVIGQELPMGKLLNAIPAAYDDLCINGWEKAAQAIMTTDTRAKGAVAQVEIDGRVISVNGIAKGSGMIRPDMATMLAYVATDVGIEQALLDNILLRSVNKSFNRITVDGDTSTNDSCILISTGSSGINLTSENSTAYLLLADAVESVLVQLAQQIVTDGEGATKFVTIQVEGATTEREALTVAYSVGQSPLVKTALFASDPNWGRIVAAIGYADVTDLDDAKVRVWLGDVLIVEHGGCADSYSESAGQKIMDQESITIKIDLGRGSSNETIWTTDLSHEYVTINADYRS